MRAAMSAAEPEPLRPRAAAISTSTFVTSASSTLACPRSFNAARKKASKLAIPETKPPDSTSDWHSRSGSQKIGGGGGGPSVLHATSRAQATSVARTEQLIFIGARVTLALAHAWCTIEAAHAEGSRRHCDGGETPCPGCSFAQCRRSRLEFDESRPPARLRVERAPRRPHRENEKGAAELLPFRFW